MTLQNRRLRPSGPGCSEPDGSRARVYTGRPRACGGIGRRARLRALWTEWSVEVRVLSGALWKAPHSGAFSLRAARRREPWWIVRAGRRRCRRDAGVRSGMPRNATVTNLCQLRDKRPFGLATAHLRVKLVVWNVQTDRKFAGRQARNRRIPRSSPSTDEDPTRANGGRYAPTRIHSGFSRSSATGSRPQTSSRHSCS